MGWRLAGSLLFAGLIAGCGGQLEIAWDDDAADDDAGDDDAADDDVADDDAADDDAADDDVADDDAADDDAADDDMGDDDSVSSCPWDGEYTGITTIELGQWPLEGPAWGEIVDCEMTGEAELDMGWTTVPLAIYGGFDGAGNGAGQITGDLGQMGTIESPWNGEAAGDIVWGEFLVDLGMGDPAPGFFELHPN